MNANSSGNPSLSDLLGVPLFHPAWYVPPYRAMSLGSWRVDVAPFHLEPGYWSGLWAVVGMPVLMRANANGDWETWMSACPHEFESQELPCKCAEGHTLIMGLGMGWIALNSALRAEVSKVTIVEQDPDVLELFRQCGALEELPHEVTAKLNLIQGDALTFSADEPVDLLYADIWRSLDEPQTLDDVRAMQSNVNARQVSFWGQEIALARHLGPSIAEMPSTQLRTLAREALHLPLLVPEDDSYGSRVQSVMANRRSRGLLTKGLRARSNA